MPFYALIIPALNEAENVGILLGRVLVGMFSEVIVVDNGSEDSTAAVAAAAGAMVVDEPQRRYGQACFSGLQRLQSSVTAVAFMDADLSDDHEGLSAMVNRFEEDR
jgi:glycosyltransferase involved in cell wall biosynthesis